MSQEDRISMTVSAILNHRRPGIDHIRLYTHNVFGPDDNWKRRGAALRAGIAELAPDLLMLQETVVTGTYDQTDDILRERYHVAHSSVRESNGSGISIASRWPIISTRELDLKTVSDRTQDFACTTLLAEIEAPEPFGPMLIVNHFPDYHTDHEVERERQTVIAARALIEAIDDRPAHVLLGGDLDAEPDSASLRFLAGKQSLEGLSVCCQNAWDVVHPGEPGHTFTSANPLAPRHWPYRRIDHIFVRCGADDMPTLVVAACELAFNEAIDGVWASDHFGLIADFTPRPPDGA